MKHIGEGSKVNRRLLQKSKGTRKVGSNAAFQGNKP